jgi:uncharacterized protein
MKWLALNKGGSSFKLSPADLVRGPIWRAPWKPAFARRSQWVLGSSPRTTILFFVVALLSFVAPLLAAPQFPPLSGRVIDQANILSPSTESKLTDLLAAHESKTTNQVVVVTLASLQGYDIADYGVQLGRAWKLGQADRNNGAILIVAPRERLVRIEVGYGLEGDLPDARAAAIIHQEIIPRFRAGDMEGGVVQGTLAILGAIEGTYEPRAAAPGRAVDDSMLPVLMIFAFFVFMVIFNGYSRGARRRGWGGPVIFPGGWGGRGGGWGGGRGGGFSGGGGSFGGGGASGRW